MATVKHPRPELVASYVKRQAEEDQLSGEDRELLRRLLGINR